MTHQGSGTSAVERRIRLNGTETTVAAATVADLLVGLGIDPTRPGTAVALNGDVAPRATWGERALCDGDRVEVIRAVQGG